MEISMGSFAPRSDLLLSTVTKVGKSTGRNLRFLHLPARYALYKAETACRTFAGVKKILDIFMMQKQKRL